MTRNATFAIPCRNAGPYLRPLLESLLAQTIEDYELLLVDDASTDDSVAIAQKIGGPRMRIERNEPALGLAGNWNRCAELVETPFFCLAHMDDVYLPNYLESMLALMADDDVGFVHCRANAIDEGGQPIAAPSESYKVKFWRGLEHAKSPEVYRRLFRGNFINCPSALYRTDAWRRVGGVDESMHFAPDWKLWFAFLLDGWSIEAESEALIRYRRHDSNATLDHARTLRRYREELDVLDFAAEHGLARGWLDPHVAQRRSAVRNNLLYDAYRDLVAGDHDAAKEKIEFARDSTPQLRDDRMVRAFRRLLGMGKAGKAVLGLGLRLALLAAR